jgi:hypothetical protein
MSNEFLKPRYKIIGDYPSNLLPVGTILELPKFDNSFTDEFWMQMHDNYPNIYQKLKWYEERQPNEMPLFIKNKTAIPVTFTKVDYWKVIERKDLGSFVQLLIVVDGKEKDVNFWAIEPATEEEYLSNLAHLESANK